MRQTGINDEDTIAALERELVEAFIMFEFIKMMPALAWLRDAVGDRMFRMANDLESVKSGFELVPQASPLRNRCSATKPL